MAITRTLTDEQRAGEPAVLLIAPQPFFDRRGSPIRVAFDAMALSRLGFSVDLLVMPTGSDWSMDGVRIHRPATPFRVNRLSIGPSVMKAVLDIFLLIAAFRLSGARRYVAIHGVEEASLIALAVGRLRGVKTVFEKHSDPGSHVGGLLKRAVMFVYAAVERFAMRRVDAVIGTGPGLVDQARRVSGKARAYHIMDIPSSLVEADEARACGIRRQWQRDKSDILILYVGSFSAYQGIDLMFEAIPVVCEAARDARFVIVGGSKSEVAKRQSALAVLGLSDRVVFAGSIAPDELPHHLRAVDVLLSPRVAGVNTPLKLLDYLKAGRAIAATDNPANRLILDNSTAVLTRQEAGAFAEGVLTLVRDPALRERLAAGGSRLIREKHNFDEFTGRLRKCYTELNLAAVPAGWENDNGH